MTGAYETVQGTGIRYVNSYAYDAQNKRIWGNTPTYNPSSGTLSDSECYYFYAPGGKLLAQFTPVYSPRMTGSPASLVFQNGPTRTYFGSRLLGNEDRLGSRGKYFPYGEDRTSPPSPPNDQVKFATYTRDSATGLDYADQRYYAATYGRFLIPDRYRPSADHKTPQTWNRYAYVQSDPINGNDPTGLIERAPCEPEDPDPFCDPEPFPEPGPGPRQPPDDPLPSCDDMANLDMYDEGTLDLIKRVFNENSFPKLGQPGWDIATGTPSGPSITWDTVQSEDLALASTVVNRANATNVSIAYASTTQAAGVGHPLYSPTFDGRWRALELPGSDVSPDCSNLAQIISAVVQVLTAGPVYPFLSWGGLSGVKQRDLPPGAFVIDLTVFYPGLTHP